VISKPQPSNLAYTGSGLPLHTDLPFYEYQPGVSVYLYKLKFTLSGYMTFLYLLNIVLRQFALALLHTYKPFRPIWLLGNKAAIMVRKTVYTNLYNK